tara:strand:- start:1772 stop:2260 length:489 start_codon:yes stop_codon:yes gene_type:complete
MTDTLKSMSRSLKSVTKSVTKSVEPIIKNDIVTYLVIFLTIALTIGYFVEKSYKAIVLLYLLAGLMYLVCKNLLCSLGISIILTNLFLSLTKIENFESIEDSSSRQDNLISSGLNQENKKSDKETDEEVIPETIKNITAPVMSLWGSLLNNSEKKNEKEKKD